MCLLSSVPSLLFGSLKEDLRCEYLVLKEFSVGPTLVLAGLLSSIATVAW